MTDIEAMRAERDELDRLIAEAEQAAADAYRAALDNIEETFRFWAQTNGQVIADTSRGHLTRLHVSGVCVELGRPSSREDGRLSVTWGDGSRARFEGAAPPAGVIVRMVQELLLHYPGTTQEGN